ncbi:MAG: PEP-CTERM sorting domain-containing protein [Candidatus Korobacteraceae bacterium]
MTTQFCKMQFARNLVLVLAFSLAVPMLHASTLSDGGSVAPSPLFPGGILEAMTSGTIITPTFTTNYTQWVYSDPGNTWCSGCLDFVYQFTDLGPDINARYTMSDFANGSNWSLDVGTNPFGLHDPTNIDRSMSGSVVGFNYNPGDEILPGETTPLLVIETNARNFNFNGFLSAQDGTAGSARAYEPAAVPEPSSLGLLGSGLMVVGGFWRKLRLGRRS